jgi:hypothetical protein
LREKGLDADAGAEAHYDCAAILGMLYARGLREMRFPDLD